MSANLLDVPDLAMTNILNYLDYPVIQNVRKSCKALRRFIDTARIGALPDYIMLTDLHETVYLQAVFKSDTSLRISVFYKKEGDGCRIKYINEKDKEEKEEKVKVLENQDYLESFSTDCKLLLANEKIVLDELENMANENSMLKIIEDILKTRNQMIQIKKIYITVADDTEVANLVQYTNPNRLERLQIQINDNISELPEIEKLPHWRHVEEFQIFSVLSEVHPQKFSHFTKCHLRCKSVDTETVKALQEIFYQTTNYKMEFHLSTDTSIHENVFFDLLGHVELFRNADYQHQWFFRIKNSSEMVLHIAIDRTRCRFRFSEKSRIPNGFEVIG